jgi:multidrug resistance efflux pump
MKQPGSKLEALEDRSEQVRDVIGKMPPVIVKWGLGIILCLLVMLFVFSWVIKYPDIISAKVTITTTNPPVPVIAEADGGILFTIQDQQNVKKGEVLGIIENPAEADDVFYIKRYLGQVQDYYADKKEFPDMLPQQHLSLGEIQSDFASFQKIYADYLLYKKKNSLQSEINHLKRRVGDYRSLLGKQRKIDTLSRKDYDLAESDFKRNRTLSEGKVISDRDMEESERKLLEATKTRETQGVNVLSADIRIAELESNIAYYELELMQKMEEYISSIHEIMRKILAAATSWEHKYVFRSVADGRVSFLNIWKNNQYVKTGDVVMVVTPEQPPEIIGKASVPVLNSGKVKVGQQINIKLNSHPYYEFGMLTGTVGSISQVPDNNNFYIVHVLLPKKLETTYKQTIQFSPMLEGTAEIMTDDQRLIERILYRFKKSVAR